MGKIKIIRGHTPSFIEKIEEAIADPDSSVINIDGGCVYTDRFGMGNLVALNLDTKEITFTENIDIEV